MTSTLRIRKTPRESKTWNFKVPVKSMVGKRFFGGDGSLGGDMITVDSKHLPWFEGLLAGGPAGADAKEKRDLENVIDVLRNGDTIDLWIEV